MKMAVSNFSFKEEPLLHMDTSADMTTDSAYPNKRRKTNDNVRRTWTDEEVAQVIQYMQETRAIGGEIEKPTANLYWDAFLKKHPFSNCTTQLLRNKHRHLRDYYVKAVKWRDSTGQEIINGQGEASYQKIFETRFKLFKRLDDLFGDRANFQPLCLASFRIQHLSVEAHEDPSPNSSNVNSSSSTTTSSTADVFVDESLLDQNSVTPEAREPTLEIRDSMPGERYTIPDVGDCSPPVASTSTMRCKRKLNKSIQFVLANASRDRNLIEREKLAFEKEKLQMQMELERSRLENEKERIGLERERINQKFKLELEREKIRQSARCELELARMREETKRQLEMYKIEQEIKLRHATELTKITLS